MRTYRNKFTGAVIETESEIGGGGWESVEDQPVPAKPQEGPKSPDSAKKTVKTVKSKAATKK